MERQKRSFCRICPGYCGLILTIDDDKITRIRGDHDHAMSDGFACIKGLQSAHLYHGPQRLHYPMARQADGGGQRVSIDDALDDIAAKIAEIVARDGPDAIGFFKGGNCYQNTLPSIFLHALIAALGTNSLFTNNTIDQSAKAVSADRLGSWNAGRNHFTTADVIMLVGGNPLVSIAVFGFDAYNPVKKLKAFKKRGSKVIVIDPRRTETAEFADIFLQPRPGEDVTLAAGMLRLILERGWHDAEFCADHAIQLAELRAAVEPFTLEYVACRADIPIEPFVEATELFARCPTGFVTTGTGPSMAARSNLMQHLYDAVDVVCGHFPRSGAHVPNPGLMKKREFRAEVNAPGRCWDNSPKSRIRGLGMLFGERMTGTLAQEITTPGEGQVKMLIVDGGNPASSVCDQYRIVDALRSLEMLVTIDPEMTPTARLAHYVLPPKLQFEHPNMVGLLEHETSFHQRPTQQYVQAAIPVPPGSELVDDWGVYYGIAQRLGLQLTIDGIDIDMVNRPTPEDMFRMLFRDGNVSFDEICQYPSGHVFEIEQYVLPGSATQARFELAPADVVEEIAEVAAEEPDVPGFDAEGRPLDLRLISRRLREVFNSAGRTSPVVRARRPYNAAYMNPEDMTERGIVDGQQIRISSDVGSIAATADGDPTLRRGIVSMAHGWGGLPEDGQARGEGSSVTLLVSTETHVEKINAMPRQSAIPVHVVAEALADAAIDAEQPEIA